MPRIGQDGREYSSRLRAGLYFFIGLSRYMIYQLLPVLPSQIWSADDQITDYDDRRVFFKDNKARNHALDRCEHFIKGEPHFQDRDEALRVVKMLRDSSRRTYFHYISASVNGELDLVWKMVAPCAANNYNGWFLVEGVDNSQPDRDDEGDAREGPIMDLNPQAYGNSKFFENQLTLKELDAQLDNGPGAAADTLAVGDRPQTKLGSLQTTSQTQPKKRRLEQAAPAVRRLQQPAACSDMHNLPVCEKCSIKCAPLAEEDSGESRDWDYCKVVFSNESDYERDFNELPRVTKNLLESAIINFAKRSTQLELVQNEQEAHADAVIKQQAAHELAKNEALAKSLAAADVYQQKQQVLMTAQQEALTAERAKAAATSAANKVLAQYQTATDLFLQQQQIMDDRVEAAAAAVKQTLDSGSAIQLPEDSFWGLPFTIVLDRAELRMTGRDKGKIKRYPSLGEAEERLSPKLPPLVQRATRKRKKGRIEAGTFRR